MEKWSPISEIELLKEIQSTEIELHGEYWNFWQLIRIEPQKWNEPRFDNEGDGFWVVGLCGNKVIWYNDKEEGFNISKYKEYGTIAEYYCNQDELSWTVLRLFELVKFGGGTIGQTGPPQSIKTD